MKHGTWTTWTPYLSVSDSCELNYMTLYPGHELSRSMSMMSDIMPWMDEAHLKFGTTKGVYPQGLYRIPNRYIFAYHICIMLLWKKMFAANMKCIDLSILIHSDRCICVCVYIHMHVVTHSHASAYPWRSPQPTTTLLASCCLSVTSGPNKRHTLIGHQTQHILLTIQDLATDYSPNPLKATNQYSNSHWPHWCWNRKHGDGREFFWGGLQGVALLWGTAPSNYLESVKDLTTPIFFAKTHNHRYRRISVDPFPAMILIVDPLRRMPNCHWSWNLPKDR